MECWKRSRVCQGVGDSNVCQFQNNNYFFEISCNSGEGVDI